eukprot:TRINITY_DN1646_c0_g4_i1.p1 TRINITY_DN1646_c0_g4~~TRINITY_DN1646_c0_g4_i1.p1  ORF type:complete len:311 (+),score=46.60 TRINITY_DN1646_c0_g4_i1:198-1130(+)
MVADHRVQMASSASGRGDSACSSDHVVVLQHGICGRPEELRNLGDALVCAFPEKLRFVLSEANAMFRGTFDGIIAGGTRLADVVRRETAPGSKLSFVGHSLGGMFARYAVRLLEDEGWFESQCVRTVNFVTIATPHCGLLEWEFYWRAGMWISGFLVGRTVQDLSLGTALLFTELIDETALRSLTRFERLVAYGNLADDSYVRPCTALILESLPAWEQQAPPTGEPVPFEALAQRGGDSQRAFIACFRAKHVLKILEKLHPLPWERYAVYFSPSDRRAAHVKICNHNFKDLENHGIKVVAHLCATFLDPS